MPEREVPNYARPYEADGSGANARVGVLLSHGFTGSPASMRPWGEYLAERGYAVSVPRLPGHGTDWKDMNRTGWADWYSEVERAFEALRARTDVVVVGGLSMGGGLALWLAAQHPHEVAALMLVNPAVSSQDRRLVVVPVAKYVVGGLDAIGGDIKKVGVTEHAYAKTPLKALHSMMVAWKQVRADLPKVTVPVLMFRSTEDHVVDDGSILDIEAGISSRDYTRVDLTDSYHVATLDNDAPTIFERSADFLARVTGVGS